MKTTLTLPNSQTIALAILPTSKTYEPIEDRKVLWEVGPQQHVLQQLTRLIDQAKEMICVQSFIMDENPVVEALVKAADRGVNIFVTGATVKLSPPEEEPEFRVENYKKLLEERFKGRFLFRAADHFHAKFILIDPKNRPAGILLTANLTTNALRKNPELALPLTTEQVRELYDLFRYHFWEQAQDEHTQRKEFAATKPVGKYQPPKQVHTVFTLQGEGRQFLRQSLLTAIEQGKSSISLSTYNLDPAHPVAQAILAKAKAGISVQLFFPERETKIKAACQPFLDAGAEVFIQPFLHAKALLVDGKHGFVFSANVEKYGLDQGWETGIPLNESQTQALRQLFADWVLGFSTLKANQKVSELAGEIRVLNGELKTQRIEVLHHKRETKLVTTLKDAKVFLSQLKPESFSRETRWEIDFQFPPAPAKFEKKAELLPGFWQIERPGKKGSAPRPALLMEKDQEIQHFLPKLSEQQLQWNCYAKG